MSGKFADGFLQRWVRSGKTRRVDFEGILFFCRIFLFDITAFLKKKKKKSARSYKT